MSRLVLLLLDPVGARRLLFARVLGSDYDLLTPRSMKEVKEALREFRPDVVLASIHQHKGHALELCTRLRRYEGGDCLMVVHGSPPGGTDMDQLRSGLGHEYKVDHWLSNNASPALVALTVKQLVRGHLGNRPLRNRRPMTPPLTPTSSSGKSEDPEISLRMTGEFEVEFHRSPRNSGDR